MIQEILINTMMINNVVLLYFFIFLLMSLMLSDVHHLNFNSSQKKQLTKTKQNPFRLKGDMEAYQVPGRAAAV